MNSLIATIVAEAEGLPADQRGAWIARRAIAAARQADASIGPEALEAEFRAWWKAPAWSAPPGFHAVRIAKQWGRHLLTRGLP